MMRFFYIETDPVHEEWVSSEDFGIHISGTNVFSAPARDYTMQTVPGRSGDLAIDNGRYNNFELVYPCTITGLKSIVPGIFDTKIREFKDALHEITGYFRLADDYYPDEFRYAIFRDVLNVAPTEDLNAATFDAVFNCKPQRYRRTSFVWQTMVSGSSTLVNSTSFPARPLIRVTGVGTLTIGSYAITVTSDGGNPYTEIDCDIMECYYGTQNRNEFVQLSSDDFPVLEGHKTYGVTFSGFSDVKIKPRWWYL